jgi:hypothetical protein
MEEWRGYNLDLINVEEDQLLAFVTKNTTNDVILLNNVV